MIPYLMTAGGLLLLLAGGDFMVRGAVAIAMRFRIPILVIGAVVVGFGTSAPELFVSVEATALEGLPELALGNAVGSNIANVLMVLGLPALLFPMICNATTLRRETLTMLGVTALFMGIAFTGVISFWMGVVLTGLLLVYVALTLRQAMAHPELPPPTFEEIDPEAEAKRPMGLIVVFLVGGIAALAIGSELLIQGASQLARQFGVNEAAIGLTIVAAGTSLPELATSFMAAYRRHCDVAYGNVLGSNIFNLLGVMGITALVADVPVTQHFLHFDLWVMGLAALLLIPFGLLQRPLTRIPAAIMVIGYIAYTYFVLDGAHQAHFMP